MTTWKLPPKIKLYEALGCLADGRIKLSGNSSVVTSSSGNKSYTTAYDPQTNAIMTNDNGSYWQGYLGYPAIAYLLAVGLIAHDAALPPLLAGIKWKDVNVKFKNDWSKTEKYCQDLVVARDGNLSDFLAGIDEIYSWLASHPLNKLGRQVKPPSGY